MQKISYEHHKEISYVMINYKDGYELSVLEDLKEIYRIKEIHLTIGRYDIIARIETSSFDLLREIIHSRIRGLQQVVATTTLMCTKEILPSLMQSTH